MHVATLVAAALDPVLTTSVFAAGQTGLGTVEARSGDDSAELRWPDQSGSVIWCAPYEEVQRRYPALPQASAEGIGVDYHCVDLTVTITSGTITEVNLEGLSLAETLAALGRREEARAADRMLGTPAAAASDLLVRLLTALLDLEPTDR